MSKQINAAKPQRTSGCLDVATKRLLAVHRYTENGQERKKHSRCAGRTISEGVDMDQNCENPSGKTMKVTELEEMWLARKCRRLVTNYLHVPNANEKRKYIVLHRKGEHEGNL